MPLLLVGLMGWLLLVPLQSQSPGQHGLSEDHIAMVHHLAAVI